MDRIVGISEHIVSTDPNEVLVTYSLGSCLGLVLHDPVAGVAGMLHAMMPASKSNPEKAAENPSMYTDTGATVLLKDMFAAGATRANLVAKVVGAASQVDTSQMFRIGERNYAIVRKVLWKNEILIAAEDVGGASSRTVYLEVGSGRTTVRSEGALKEI